jgi:hypothetical protein
VESEYKSVSGSHIKIVSSLVLTSHPFHDLFEYTLTLAVVASFDGIFCLLQRRLLFDGHDDDAAAVVKTNPTPSARRKHKAACWFKDA